jgi:uncharacterized membrane protein YbhN (UPF0104 family)
VTADDAAVTIERAGGGRAARFGRWARWALAALALAFVAWVVPWWDHCWDPAAPSSTRARVVHEAGGSCVLRIASGDVTLDPTRCALLKCEPGALSTIGHAHVGVLAALLVLYALGTLAWAARWRALLTLAGVAMPLLQVWRVSIEAQAGGVLLPGGIGGDALRIASVAARLPKDAARRSRLPVVVGSVLLDRVVGLAVVTGLAAALAFVWGGVAGGPLAAAVSLLPLGIVGGLVFVRKAPLDRIRWLGEGRIGGVTRPLLAYARDSHAPFAVAAAASWSVAVAAAQFVTIRGFVFALGGVPTAEKWVYVGTAMAFVVSAVPALPGAWGTADAAYVFFLALAGLAPGTALAVCLLYRLFWYLSAIVGAVLYLVRPAATVAGAGLGAAPAEPPA